jgi:hypothetical protein
MERETGPLWARMNAQPRRGLASLLPADISVRAGFYAIYRDEAAVYVGKAKTLRGRLSKNHLHRGLSMTNSALRRNICEHLGIASAAGIKARRYTTTSEDATRIWEWLEPCEVAWIECLTDAEASELERTMKSEWRPLLTKR